MSYYFLLLLHGCRAPYVSPRETMQYVSWMLVVLPLTAPGPALAQCDGQIVSAIAIAPRAPSFIQFPRLLRPLARAVGLHHTTTKADVTRRFLLLSVGQPCTERLRTESERILRFQPFLADARVRAFPDEAGGAAPLRGRRRRGAYRPPRAECVPRCARDRGTDDGGSAARNRIRLRPGRGHERANQRPVRFRPQHAAQRGRRCALGLVSDGP